jgi:F0F1-type ATP synthase assembly protein I
MDKKTPPEQNKTSKKQVNFLKYTSMAAQMGVTIGLFIFVGLKLDAWLETKVLFILIGSLLGVGLSLYHFIKQAILDNES